MKQNHHPPMIENLLSSGGRHVWPMLREQFPSDDDLYGMLAALWAAGVEDALLRVTSGRRALAGTAARDAAYTLAQRRDPRLRALLDGQAGRRIVASLEAQLAARVSAALGLGAPAPAVEIVATTLPASLPATRGRELAAVGTDPAGAADPALLVPEPRQPAAAEVLGEVTA
jgi:hypothetical protein